MKRGRSEVRSRALGSAPAAALWQQRQRGSVETRL